MNPSVFSRYFIPNTEGKLGWKIRNYKIGGTLYTHMVTTHRCLLSARIPPLALLQCGGGGFSSRGQQQQTTTTYEIRPGSREVSRTIEFPPSFAGGFCLRGESEAPSQSASEFSPSFAWGEASAIGVSGGMWLLSPQLPRDASDES